MAFLDTDDATIHYEVHGEGFPILLIAPGGMNSAISKWESTPWNPVAELRDRYQVIVMDQRNAGHSKAPVRGSDGWHVYAQDQLSLMDHLGVDEFHVAGMCIGGPYSMGLIKAARARVVSAVLFQPIGLRNNRQAFYDLFDSWASALQPEHPDVSASDWRTFRSSMFGGDFLFNVDREFVRGCDTPLLVLCGNDLYHPEAISREVVELAPNASLVERWKGAAEQEAARAQVSSFLRAKSGA